MSATATPRVSKKKLTLAEAAEQWQTAKRAIKENEALLKEAAPVLIEHFERTGRHTYKDRIAFAVSTREVLDQQAVREFLGAQVARFLKRVPIKQLSLLQ